MVEPGFPPLGEPEQAALGVDPDDPMTEPDVLGFMETPRELNEAVLLRCPTSSASSPITSSGGGLSMFSTLRFICPTFR